MFQYVSDLHLEMNPGFRMTNVTAPHLILAGDIGDPLAGEYADFLTDCAGKYKTVFVVLGNHEGYNNGPWAATVRAVKGVVAGLQNVVLLDRTSFDIPGTDVRVAGTTLWSHIPVGAANDATCFVADFRRIAGMDVTAYNDMHAECVTWLAAEKALAEVDGKQLVVVTHHAPYTVGTSHPSKTSVLNCAFATDLSHLFGAPLVAWVYGHTHHCGVQTVNGTLLVSNQRGYAHEDTCGFDPDLQIGEK